MPENRLFLSPPYTSQIERELVTEAFDSNYVAPLGPMVDAFEHELAQYTGYDHVLALSSGTAALHIALRLIGVTRGDKVISSTLTFIGGVAPILYEGGEPIFIDADPTSWLMDLNLLEDELGRLARAGTPAKAVIVCDLYGQPSDVAASRALAERYGARLVVDSAEALGSFLNGKHSGWGAEFALLSFNGNKIITTSGGGALGLESRAALERAKKLSQAAREAFIHYEHVEYGYNYRLSNVLAAIGRGQLTTIADRVARRRSIFDGYVERLGNLPGVSFMPEVAGARANRWLSAITIDPNAFGADREAVRVALESENIESRPTWKPMHLQPLFSSSRAVGGQTAERLFDQGLCLPSGTGMSRADVGRVAEIIQSLHPH